MKQLRQAVIVLRPDDEIDGGLPAQDFPALGLRDAAGDDQRRLAPLRGAFCLEFADLAEFGIDLFGGALADVAGVEDDEIGVLDRLRLGKALLARNVGHALRVVDVHLAAEGLDEHATRIGGGHGGPGQIKGLQKDDDAF